MICRGGPLSLQKLLETVRAKLDSCGVRRFRNSIGIEQNSVTGLERQHHRRISCKREFSEKQTIFLNTAQAFGSTPQEQGRVTGAGVCQRAVLHVDEQVCRCDEMVLEL